MQDQLGKYYYPDPADTNTRVYVRTGRNGPEFRLWRDKMPEVWDRHDWLPYSVIEAAADMYREKKSGADPLLLYDINVARALLKN